MKIAWRVLVRTMPGWLLIIAGALIILLSLR